MTNIIRSNGSTCHIKTSDCTFRCAAGLIGPLCFTRHCNSTVRRQAGFMDWPFSCGLYCVCSSVAFSCPDSLTLRPGARAIWCLSSDRSSSSTCHSVQQSTVMNTDCVQRETGSQMECFSVRIQGHKLMSSTRAEWAALSTWNLSVRNLKVCLCDGEKTQKWAVGVKIPV